MWGDDFDPEKHKGMLRTAQDDAYYPTVDVFLPVCGEPTHLLDNTWKYVRALDYPNVTVHILDDGGKEEVQQLAAMYEFNCRFLGGLGWTEREEGRRLNVRRRRRFAAVALCRVRGVDAVVLVSAERTRNGAKH